MAENSSHVTDNPDPRRSGAEWFLNAVFPNGKTVSTEGLRETLRRANAPPTFDLLNRHKITVAQ